MARIELPCCCLHIKQNCITEDCCAAAPGAAGGAQRLPHKQAISLSLHNHNMPLNLKLITCCLTNNNHVFKAITTLTWNQQILSPILFVIGPPGVGNFSHSASLSYFLAHRIDKKLCCII
jgi:hypothetical protein